MFVTGELYLSVECATKKPVSVDYVKKDEHSIYKDYSGGKPTTKDSPNTERTTRSTEGRDLRINADTIGCTHNESGKVPEVPQGIPLAGQRKFLEGVLPQMRQPTQKNYYKYIN